MNTTYLEQLYVELLKTKGQRDGGGATDYNA